MEFIPTLNTSTTKENLETKQRSAEPETKLSRNSRHGAD